MTDLYRKAVLTWGQAMPDRLKNLKNRTDENVSNALAEIIGDVTSSTWTIDARIAWALMQGRDVE